MKESTKNTLKLLSVLGASLIDVGSAKNNSQKNLPVSEFLSHIPPALADEKEKQRTIVEETHSDDQDSDDVNPN